MSLPIIVLHGANGSARNISPLVDALAGFGTRVVAPDLLGHGGRAVPDRLTIEAMGSDLLAWMDQQGMARAVLAGYSHGGYLALWMARHHPARVAGVFCLATKFVFDVDSVAKWLYLSEIQRLETLPDNRPALLAERHAPQDWQLVLERNRQLWRDLVVKAPLQREDIAAINVPALVVSGDADQVVSMPETGELARLLRTKAMMFRGPAHPIEVVPLGQLAEVMRRWMERLPAA